MLNRGRLRPTSPPYGKEGPHEITNRAGQEGRMNESKEDSIKWTCLDCRWMGPRHETDTSFFFIVLCPKCGGHKLEKNEQEGVEVMLCCTSEVNYRE